MPTGYTAAIHDGVREITFREFASECARAFGAAIMLREEPHGPIPPKLPAEDSYHRDALAKAERALREARDMPLREAGRLAKEAHESEVADVARRERERKARVKRYRAMLGKVRAWTPPTPDHHGLKDFMVQQLEESMRFDCGGRRWEAGPRKTAEQFKHDAVAQALRDVEYHAKNLREDLERHANRQAWVDALYASLEGA